MLWQKAVGLIESALLPDAPLLVLHTPGHMNMNLGSRTGDFAKTSLGKIGGKQSLSWINESSMESYLLL
jgi:hypothetical protein